jgi:hypothetical protein
MAAALNILQQDSFRYEVDIKDLIPAPETGMLGETQSILSISPNSLEHYDLKMLRRIATLLGIDISDAENFPIILVPNGFMRYDPSKIINLNESFENVNDDPHLESKFLTPYGLISRDSKEIIKDDSPFGLDISNLISSTIYTPRMLILRRISGFLKYPNLMEYYKPSPQAGLLIITETPGDDETKSYLSITLYDAGKETLVQHWENGLLMVEITTSDNLNISRDYSMRVTNNEGYDFVSEKYYMFDEAITFKADKSKTTLTRSYSRDDRKFFITYYIGDKIVTKETYYLELTRQKQILEKVSKVAAASITTENIPLHGIIGEYLNPSI